MLPASPDRKKPRRGGMVLDDDDKEEQGGFECGNLLGDLPYVAFRRLLDFLSSATASAEDSAEAVLAGVPELCRVRAESGRFAGELEWGEDVAPGEEEAFEQQMEAQEKHLRSLRPYHALPRHHDSIGSVAALRLTCHAIKNAVDHALGASAQASAVYAPLDQFLVDHFFPAAAAASSAGADKEAPPLPLLSDSAEAACTKERFRKMADLTLGVAQARLHQSRLDEVLEYVWRTGEFAPAKLEALRQQLLAPRAAVAGGDQGPQAAPLLKVEYLRHEDDYLGQSYGLGIRACLSLGLPDMPHERAEVGLWVVQAWDNRDEGWDLQVYVDLRSASASWKQHLESVGQDQQDEAKAEEEEQVEEEEEEASAPLHVVVFDYYRSRGEIADQTTANFTLLRKLWQCVGLGGGSDDGDDDASDQDLSWKGKEVLTTLLACLGFAWHDDVDLLWEDCDDDDADAVNEHVAGIGRGRGRRGGRRRVIEAQNTTLLQTSRVKHKELQELAPYVAQLNAFLDARHQSAATEVKTREQVLRHVRRFIGQQRLARTDSYIRQRLRGGEPWPSSAECPEFAHVDGLEVAKQLRVVYARTLDLEPGEYSNFSDRTVELAFPVSADALRRVGLAGDGEGDDDDGHHSAGPLGVVIRVSTKSANCYTGTHAQSMVTARVVGHHPRLSAALAATAVAVPNTAFGLEGRGKPDSMAEEEEGNAATEASEKGEEEEDTVVLKLDRDISDLGRHNKVMATEAAELVGRLLGLAIRPTAGDAPQATADPDGTGGPMRRSDPAMETTPFSRAVLSFLDEAAKVATCDAEEGTFPVQSTLRQKWDQGEDDGDDDDDAGDEEDTSAKEEQRKSLLTQEISNLCGGMDMWA